MERPLGVTLLASFFFLQGAINLFILAGLYLEGASTFSVAYYVVLSIAGLALAYGMWEGYRWGRMGTMALAGWEMLIGVIGAFVALDFEPASPIEALTKTVVYAIVAYFLTRPEISEYFTR